MAQENVAKKIRNENIKIGFIEIPSRGAKEASMADCMGQVKK